MTERVFRERWQIQGIRLSISQSRRRKTLMKCLRGQVFQVYPVYRQSAEASPSADEAARTLVPHLTFLLMWHITSCGRRPFRVGRSRVEFFPAPRKSSL